MKNTYLKDVTKVPNLLSIFRLILIPICMYGFLSEAMSNVTILSIVAVSWLSDILDGFIARRFNMITELGKLLDPLADKLTQVSVLFCLWIVGYIHTYIFVILFAKDLLLAIGALYLKKVVKLNMIQANVWGKIATGLFYIATILYLFKVDEAIYVIYLTLVLMLIAFCTYVKEWVRVKNIEKMKEDK